MFRKCAITVFAAILAFAVLCSGALAEVQYAWEGEFPEIPALQHHAYRAEGAAFDADALVSALWNGKDHVCEENESSIRYRLEKNLSDSGFCEDVYLWEDGEFSYIVDRTEWPDWTDIGGAEAAYAAAEEWLSAWLPAEWYAVRSANFGSFDEDGNPVDHWYSLSWMQEIEPGVAAYEPGVRVEYYSCGVNSAYIDRREFVPAEMDPPAYLTAQQALQSLNHAAANIDPAHVCTSFDDPEDKLVAIDAVMSSKFNEEEIYTLCWQFTIQDARKGFVRTVLVDAVSGDIYDDHDGRLEGCF